MAEAIRNANDKVEEKVNKYEDRTLNWDNKNSKEFRKAKEEVQEKAEEEKKEQEEKEK